MDNIIFDSIDFITSNHDTNLINSDRVEAVCRLSDLFERRLELMKVWADYIAEGDRNG